jgi:hypothetical protein
VELPRLGGQRDYAAIEGELASSQTSALNFAVGGEVFDRTQFSNSCTDPDCFAWVVPMGTGASPIAGYTQAGGWQSQQVELSTGVFSTNFGAPFSTEPTNYGFFQGQDSNGVPTVFFGNSTNVWWGQNTPYTLGDWLYGSYKGGMWRQWGRRPVGNGSV